MIQVGRLMRFFGGDDVYWFSKQTTEIAEWVDALVILEARERLQAITATTYPQMKKKDQSAIARSLEKQAYPRVEKKKLTMAELADRLKGFEGG